MNYVNQYYYRVETSIDGNRYLLGYTDRQKQFTAELIESGYKKDALKFYKIEKFKKAKNRISI